MTSKRGRLMDELFQAALEREPAERAAFLAEACAADDELRREVESLLASYDEDSGFMEEPLVGVAARLLAERQVHARIGQQIGHYKILKLIGAGGMGEVYLAQDTMLGRRVAVKLLPAHFTTDNERVRRFQREARSASALNHPNILTVHEIGQADSTHFIATEFIDGATLREHMTSTTMKMTEALDVAIQVASALSAAHEEGIVHRDIKPENIMLRRRDRIVKVLDFGLAKLTEQKVPAIADPEAATMQKLTTHPGVVMGTVAYMSPEQARGLPVDGRTDIWSLGVVLYEMVTGHAPFRGETMSDVLVSILDKQPPPLADYLPEVPSRLQQIIERALDKDVERRYRTAEEVRADLSSLKRELDDETGRPSQPALIAGAGASSGGRERIETAGDAAVSTGGAGGTRPTPSAEYVVGEVKRHKVGASLLGLMLIAAVAGILYFSPAGAGKKEIDSVAVLPFVNVSAAPEVEYLSDGITETLINNLSQLANLRVMSRNSAFRYKGREVNAHAVGQELAVGAVLTGRVTQHGDTLAINVELVNARDNSQIWGHNYRRKLSDIFSLQEEIAEDVSERLRLKLTGKEKQQIAKRYTENIKAYQYYMQGRSHIHRRTREDLLAAMNYFEKAIEEDRNYALAYAGLAEAYTNLGTRAYIAPADGHRKSKEAAHKALSLDENLAEAHVAVGKSYIDYAPYDFSTGDNELRRAIEISPSLAVAYLNLGLSYMRQGRLDEALQELSKARELDPLSSIIARVRATNYILRRDHVQALEILRQANELGPAFSSNSDISAYVLNGAYDEALAGIEKEKLTRKDDPLLIYDAGVIYAAQGKREEALKTIKELEGLPVGGANQAHFVAKIYATLGEEDMTLNWLERGLAAGAIGAFYKDEPVWDAVRSDPRFLNLIRRMGIQKFTD